MSAYTYPIEKHHWTIYEIKIMFFSEKCFEFALHVLTGNSLVHDKKNFASAPAASFTCESFSADALFTMDRKRFDERLTEYRAMTRWDW